MTAITEAHRHGQRPQRRVNRRGVRLRAGETTTSYWSVFTGYAVLGLMAFIALFPVITIWLTGLKSQADLSQSFFGLPSAWRFENLVEAWDSGHFSKFFTNSIIVVVPVVVFSLLFSTLAGYAFARWRFRFSGALFFLLLLGLMVPFEGVIIPLYYYMKSLGLLNTYWALILPQIGLSVAFGTFWMRAFFLTAEKELFDAAAVDGAGPFQTLRLVMLPLARPALMTLGVLVFTWTWNEFLLALVLAPNQTVQTLPVGLGFFVGQHVSDIPLLAAASSIVSVPIVIVFIIFQRSFIRGMVGGAIKG